MFQARQIAGPLLMLLAASCSGSDAPPGDASLYPVWDGAGSNDGGVPRDGGSGRDQRQGDATADADGGAGGPNSGAICAPTSTCTPATDTCTVFDNAVGKGMCLAPCGNQGDLCPVADQSTQLSVCSVRGLDGTSWFCGWYCELGGKSYRCPNDSDFKCVPSANGVAVFCRPR